MNPSSPFKREQSKSSFTDDDDLSRMSDLESDYTNNHSSSSANGNNAPNINCMGANSTAIHLQAMPSSSTSSRRMSLSSLPPASPSSSSYNKMSVDSDDARSVSSMTSRNNYTGMMIDSSNSNSNGRRLVASISSPTSTGSPNNTAVAVTVGNPDQHHQQQHHQQQHHQQQQPQQQHQQGKAVMTPSAIVTAAPRIIKPIGSQWSALAAEKMTTIQSDSSNTTTATTSTTTTINNTAVHPLSTTNNPTTPERRSVNRRSSLMPRSKALLRVIDQADEDTHLADIEMRREHDTTQQIKHIDNQIAEHYQGAVPPASWTRVDMPLYQCSRLNPEIEMTSFQLENLTCPSPQQQQQYKSIKRKASEDRFDSIPTPLGLKRRAVSPSLSLNGSPVLTGYNSPPTTSLACFGNSTGNSTNGSNSNSSIHSSNSGSGSSPNAAARARAQQKASAFNLHEASGGLSRMSLSE